MLFDTFFIHVSVKLCLNLRACIRMFEQNEQSHQCTVENTRNKLNSFRILWLALRMFFSRKIIFFFLFFNRKRFTTIRVCCFWTFIKIKINSLFTTMIEETNWKTFVKLLKRANDVIFNQMNRILHFVYVYVIKLKYFVFYLLGLFESNDFECMCSNKIVSQQGIIVLILLKISIFLSTNAINGSFQVRKTSSNNRRRKKK